MVGPKKVMLNQKTFMTVLATTNRDKRISPDVFWDSRTQNHKPMFSPTLCQSTEADIETNWVRSAVLTWCVEFDMNTVYIWRLEDFDDLVAKPDEGDFAAGLRMGDIFLCRPWRTYYVEDLGLENEEWYNDWKTKVANQLLHANKDFVDHHLSEEKRK